MRTWILQANPKMYDIDGALEARDVIYWRVPQYVDQVEPQDRVLIWRAGKEAGVAGWGVVLAQPQYFDLSHDQDPFVLPALRAGHNDVYAPIRVWRGENLPKDVVRAAIPEHRIVTAPMGTVFPVTTDELTALKPLLIAHGYELERNPSDAFTPLPVLAGIPEPEPAQVAMSPRAKITPALFLLTSAPEQPVEITIEGDALRLVLVEREFLKALDESWDAAGIYLLLGSPSTDGAALSVYVGKAQGLRARIRTGHALKEWNRCLLIQRPGLHPFNASDISWLERRLIDILLEATTLDLINKAPPPQERVPEYKAEILERTVVASLAVLGLLGARVA